MPVCRALAPVVKETLVHTGQHYDRAMSGANFECLGLPAPDYNLNVGSGSHADQTAKVMLGFESLVQRERPDLVLVYGDTNSTLGAALATTKLGCPRPRGGWAPYRQPALGGGDQPNPYGRLSDLLFCPTRRSARNLAEEGIREGVFFTGDVMADTFRLLGPTFAEPASVLEGLGLAPGQSYVVVTAHRAENVDEPERLRAVVEVLTSISEAPVVFPVHPRTMRRLRETGLMERLESASGLHVVPPLDYVEMMRLVRGAGAVVTDSGRSPTSLESPVSPWRRRPVARDPGRRVEHPRLAVARAGRRGPEPASQSGPTAGFRRRPRRRGHCRDSRFKPGRRLMPVLAPRGHLSGNQEGPAIALHGEAHVSAGDAEQPFGLAPFPQEVGRRGGVEGHARCHAGLAVVRRTAHSMAPPRSTRSMPEATRERSESRTGTSSSTYREHLSGITGERRSKPPTTGGATPAVPGTKPATRGAWAGQSSVVSASTPGTSTRR